MEHDVNFVDHRIHVIALLVSFWTWCGLLTFPMISSNQDLSEVVHVFSSSGAVLMAQAAGLAFFLIVACLTQSERIALALRSLRPTQFAILLTVYLSVALQLHDNEAATLMGILYTCLLLVTASILSLSLIHI